MSFRRNDTWVLVALMLASALPMRSAGKPLGPLTVVFSVTDKKGQPVTDLKATDIKIREDGKEQAITGIRNVTASPLSIALLVDGGSSTATVPNYWQNEAIGFFTSALRKGVDKGAVFHFRNTVVTTQDLTDEIPSLSTAVKQTGAVGPSALYNALSIVTDSLGKAAGRRALILIADGDDIGSAVTPDIAVQKLRDNGVVVYPIVVKSERVLPPDQAGEFLKRVADETGGVVFNSAKLKEAHEVFETIEGLLAAQYELQYQPAAANTDGKLHKFRIELADKNLKVRQPSGYYARP